MKAINVEVTCDKHIHNRKPYTRGQVIENMPEHQAKRLIEQGRAKKTTRTAKDPVPQDSE